MKKKFAHWTVAFGIVWIALLGAWAGGRACGQENRQTTPEASPAFGPWRVFRQRQRQSVAAPASTVEQTPARPSEPPRQHHRMARNTSGTASRSINRSTDYETALQELQALRLGRLPVSVLQQNSTPATPAESNLPQPAATEPTPAEATPAEPTPPMVPQTTVAAPPPQPTPATPPADDADLGPPQVTWPPVGETVQTPPATEPTPAAEAPASSSAPTTAEPSTVGTSVTKSTSPQTDAQPPLGAPRPAVDLRPPR